MSLRIEIFTDGACSGNPGKGGYGIVSCYNSLPLAGGGNTLVRINLKQVALRSESSQDFFTRQLPYYCRQQINIIDARTDFLYNQSHFFEQSFLVKEGAYWRINIPIQTGIRIIENTCKILLNCILTCCPSCIKY